MATVWLSGGAFFWINLAGAFLIGAALTPDVLNATHARCFWSIGLAATAFFSGHGGSIGLLDAYAQGRVRVPTSPPTAAATRAQNPWQVALMQLLVWGLPAAVVSFWVAPRLWPSGVPLKQFAWQFAILSALLSAVIIARLSGAPFLAQTRLAPRERAFEGNAAEYLWRRHALPQALVNAIINGWIGVAIMPARVHDGGALIAPTFVLGDIAATLCVLGLGIAGAVNGYVRFDRRWGVAPLLHASRASLARQFVLSAAGILLLTAVGCLISGLGVRSVNVFTFLIGRSLGCGVYSGWIAYWLARWVMSSRAPAVADARS